MIYTHRQPSLFASAHVADALANAVDTNQSTLSYLSLLSAFAARIAKPELNADERMQAWDDLMQSLKETH